ncbi:MAG: HD domain-containing protein, partial [Selenomonas sp.]|nr:HD domain-containing protein [Selenomonas sp.]
MTDFTEVVDRRGTACLKYDFAAERHEGQKRRSGEPYIIHPLAVASYLVDLGMDDQCICAALLH